MPELPDVEVFRRYFDRHALGKTVVSVLCKDPLVIGTLGRKSLDRVLPGRRFRSTRRHGKYLFASAEALRKPSRPPVWVVFHFGMTGSFAWVAPDGRRPAFARVVFQFQGGSALVFVCPRRFGRVAWLNRPEDLIESKRLGPDPLDPNFGPDGLRRALSARRGAIKAVLLDQTALAGVGNLYADEALFQASMHPRTPANALEPAEWKRLQRTLTRVLRRAIDAGVDSTHFSHRWLLPRRREGGPCPRCGAALRRITVGGRTTYYCPRHQKLSSRRSLKR